MATAPPLVDPRDLLATAYHEAGHVVMAWTCGHEVGSATVARGANHVGRVFHRATGRRGHLDHVDPRIRAMMIAAAGALAEGRAGFEGAFFGSLDDLKSIQAPLAELAAERGVSRQDLWGQVEREVWQALGNEEVWAAVENVAAALVAHGTLVQDEIENIICNS